jgi:hypothetical protein
MIKNRDHDTSRDDGDWKDTEYSFGVSARW